MKKPCITGYPKCAQWRFFSDYANAQAGLFFTGCTFKGMFSDIEACKAPFLVLRFYGPVNRMGSCWAPSVYLSTLLLGRLSPPSSQPVYQYCAYSFARNWQMPFLNQWKGENDRRKYFMIKSPRKYVADPAEVEPATSWSPVRCASTEAGRFLFVSGLPHIWRNKKTANISDCNWKKHLLLQFFPSSHLLIFYGKNAFQRTVSEWWQHLSVHPYGTIWENKTFKCELSTQIQSPVQWYSLTKVFSNPYIMY